MEAKRWQDWVMLVLGVWVFFSPFWMPGYASQINAAAWNSYVMGILLVAFSWGALVNRKMWEERVNLAIGIWLIVASFFLAIMSGQDGAAWNQVIVGVLVVIDALSVLGNRASSAHIRAH